MKKILLAALIICVSADVFAHEIATHKRIGDAAVVYLQMLSAAQSPQRLLPTGSNSVSLLQNILQIGAEHEDDDFGIPGYGRYFFHFTPALKNDRITANGCSSIGWSQSAGYPAGSSADGFDGCAIISGILHTNSFRWDQDLTAYNDGSPTGSSLNNLGYMIHLLEDLGSPPHTLNDAHPCPVSPLSVVSSRAFYCDEFEKFNDNQAYAPYGDPQNLPGGVWSSFVAAAISSTGVETPVILTNGFVSPVDFFTSLQQYTRTNYYSNRTASLTQGTGPQALFSDRNYIYGECIVSATGIDVSQNAGTCHYLASQSGTFQWVRKIAHKGALYWASCPLAWAGLSSDQSNCGNPDIDQTIAREQFAELGPVIAQHVAAFIRFYAPAVSVTINGTGTGTVTSSVTSSANSPSAPAGPNQINCTSRHNVNCSGLFVQTATSATTVTLAAAPAPGSTFTGWSGNCAGTDNTTTVMPSGDLSCTATFAINNNPILTVSASTSGTISSSPSGINCGSSCTAAFPAGTSVTLTATPAAGRSFTGWSGACSGTTTSTTIILTSDQNCTATFASTPTKFTYIADIDFANVNCGQTVTASFSAVTASGIPVSFSRSYTGCLPATVDSQPAGGGPDYSFTGEATTSSSGPGSGYQDTAICSVGVAVDETVGGQTYAVSRSVWVGNCFVGGGALINQTIGDGPIY